MRHPHADKLIAKLDEPTTDVTLWADQLTAPAVNVTVRSSDGAATLWSVSLHAAGVEYVDDGYRYWPDRDLDPDIPSMPIVLASRLVTSWAALSFFCAFATVRAARRPQNRRVPNIGTVTSSAAAGRAC